MGTMTHQARFQSSQCSCTRSVHVHAHTDDDDDDDKTWPEQDGIGNLDSEQMARAILTIDGRVKAMMSLSHAQMM